MANEETGKDILSLTAESIMIKDVHTILPSLTVREAILLLLKEKISGMPVVDTAGKPISVVSQIDLMKFAATGSMEKPLSAMIDKLVTTDKLIVVLKHDPFKEILKQFLIKPVRRVLVVDNGGKLHGIISRSTILQAFMDTSE